jgi:hypothetical protein
MWRSIKRVARILESGRSCFALYQIIEFEFIESGDLLVL